MVKVDINLRMEPYTQAISFRADLKVLVAMSGLMNAFMKEIGKIASAMAKLLKYGKMDVNMSVITVWIKKKDKVSILGQMGANIKGRGKMASKVEEVNTLI